MTKEALKLALEALEVANSCVDGYYIPKGRTQLPEIELAITAIKEALAQPEQEPVAWEQFYPDMGKPQLTPPQGIYYTPPQRTWVGLTDKDWNRSKHNYDFQKGVDWAESILKEKNT